MDEGAPGHAGIGCGKESETMITALAGVAETSAGNVSTPDIPRPIRDGGPGEFSPDNADDNDQGHGGD